MIMDSKNYGDEPESPKKKVCPTTKLISPSSPSLESTDYSSGGLEDQEKLVNGVAPTRRGRFFNAPSIGERTEEVPEPSRGDPGIQEEVVSSSEIRSTRNANPVPCIGDADSLTNDTEDVDRLDPEENVQVSRNAKEDPETM